MLHDQRQTVINFDRNASLVAHLLETVGRYGSRPAVSCEDQTISYAELDRRSLAWALHLRARMVSKKAPVAILMERSIDLIVALVAVLRAGAPYVPIDPMLPDARRAFILADCGASILLTHSSVQQRPAFDGTTLDFDAAVAADRTSEPLALPGPDDLAYIIYTSGSTGKPKGVLCHHRGALNMLADGQLHCPLGHGDRCSWWTAPGFDVSVYEIFSALTVGAELVVVPEVIRADGAAFCDWLSHEQITAAYVPPMMVRDLEGWVHRHVGLSSLRRMLTGVEPIPEQLLCSIIRAVSGLHIINGYGPTEAAVYCTAYHLCSEAAESRRIAPIGRPLAGVEVYLFDESLQSVAPGEEGELVIGGVQVERGYLNCSQLTATAFVDDPLRGRLYRSGDRARLLPDGNLMFCGRMDQQVKFLGHRIELGEIEAALCQLSIVYEAAVCVREVGGGVRLVAYYSLAKESDEVVAQLRTHLINELPSHMVPSLFIHLSHLPFTRNGKVDRKALPSPTAEDLARLRAAEFQPPATPEQRAVARIFSELLQFPSIGLQDDFFRLGGHSLLATQALSRLGRGISLCQFYENSTVAALADLLTGQTETSGSIPVAPTRVWYPLTPSQRSMWMMHYTGRLGTLSNIPGVMHMTGPLNVFALEEALNEIVRRHDALRMCFSVENGQVVQRPHDEATVLVPVIDLSPLDVAARDRRLAGIEAENGAYRFDLAKAPLMRAMLIRLSENRHELYLNIHHIVIDGWGLGVMIREFAALYEAFASGKNSSLPPPARQYRDVAVWMDARLTERAMVQQLDYWRKQLAAPRPDVHFQLDAPRPEQSAHRAARRSFTVLPQLTKQLIELGREENASLFMVLVAIWQSLLFRESGSADIVTGTAIAGRNHPQLEEVIGTCINSLALRTDFSDVLSFRDLLARVRLTALEAYAHQEVPFEKVLEQIDGSAAHPIFRNSLILHNMPPSPRQFAGISVTSVEVGNDTSKMDTLLYFLERDGQLEAQLEYDTELFEPLRIERLVHDFITLARQVVADASRPLEAYWAEGELLAPSCSVIGEGSLCLRCIDVLQRSGLKVVCLISPDPENRRWAQKHNISSHHPSEGIESTLAAAPFDFLFSIVNSRILSPEVLALPRRAAINYHDSPLPRYAGVYATAWAILNREKMHGITWHLMAGSLDTGDILKQKSVQLYDCDTSFTLNARCYDAAAEALAELAAELIEGREIPTRQDLRFRSYCPLYKRPAGGALIDWSRPAHEIDALRRALDFGTQPNDLGLPKVFLGGEIYLLFSDGRLCTVDGELTDFRFPALGEAMDWVVNDPKAEKVRNRLEDLIARNAPYERFWVEQFEAFQPLEFPPGMNELSQRHSLADSALFLCFLSRFCSQNVLGVGWRSQPEMPEFSMDTLPLCITFDLQQSLSDNLERAHRRLAQVGQHGACARDLHLRFPSLDALPTYPIVLSSQRVDCSARLWNSFRAFRRSADFDQPLYAQSILTPSDERALEKMERQVPGFDNVCCIHHLFEAQAHRTPEALALESEAGALSYAELDRRADALASHLHKLGLQPGALVGLFISRSLEMYIGLLGILKVGGAYVPLDPDYPLDRIRFMIEDARMPWIVSVRALEERLEQVPCRVVCLDAISTSTDSAPLANRSASVASASPHDPAYVLYTSGSTGTPKGVVVEHRNVVNHCLASLQLYGIDARDRVLQFFSMNFDGSVEELFPAWACGATVVLRSDLLSSSTMELEQFVEEHAISVVDLPTAYWHEWVRNLRQVPSSLRAVIIGGEKVSVELCRVWMQKAASSIRLFNTYGPTECTVVASAQEIRGAVGRDISIGRPIAGTSFFVVDPQLQRVPVGVVGELLIGGAGVARGYLNRPELTAERFIKNPWGDGRLYRTGDLVYFCKDGRVGFVGRADHQVKIRGFRIEPDEIASALERHAGVSQALVMVRSDISDQKELAAYWISGPGHAPDAAALRQFLADNMPSYMVPAAFLNLDEFPVAPGGKVDRKALPSPVKVVANEHTYVAPSRPMQKVLAQIWSTVLGIEKVGIHDNFFDLGGHSLLAIQLVDRVLSSGAQLSVADLFQGPTIAQMAELIETRPVGESMQHECLLLLKKGRSDRPPFFLLHSAPGDLFGYSNLVHHLPAEQPVYGFQSVGLVNPEQMHSTLPEMAARYVSVLNDWMPDGPVLLGGWCYGGFVAMEMAQLLQKQGRDVQLLALIDAWAYQPAECRFAFYRRRLQLMRIVGVQKWMQVIRQKLCAKLFRSHPDPNEELDGFSPTAEGILANRNEVYRRNMAATRIYHPRYYPGPVTLFRSSELAHSLLPDMTMEWAALTPSQEVHLVPGDHRNMLADPHVKTLSRLLFECIENAIHG